MAVFFEKKTWNNGDTIESADFDRIMTTLCELLDSVVVDNNNMVEGIKTILSTKECLNLPENPTISELLIAISYLEEK